MTTFNRGDKLRCIDGNQRGNFVKGAIYTYIGQSKRSSGTVSPFYINIKDDKGNLLRARASRFVLHEIFDDEYEEVDREPVVNDLVKCIKSVGIHKMFRLAVGKIYTVLAVYTEFPHGHEQLQVKEIPHSFGYIDRNRFVVVQKKKPVIKLPKSKMTITTSEVSII